MHETFLIHSGTKGMKWGERRYQYSDGSYTELGKLRRRVPSSEINPGGMRNATWKRRDRQQNESMPYSWTKRAKNEKYDKRSANNSEQENIEEARRKLDEVFEEIDEMFGSGAQSSSAKKGGTSKSSEGKTSSSSNDKTNDSSKNKDGQKESQNDSKKDSKKNENKRPGFGALVKDTGKAIDSIKKVSDIKKKNDKIERMNAEVAKMSDDDLRTIYSRLQLEKKYIEAVNWKGSQKKKIELSDIFNAVSDTAAVFATLRDFLKD